MRRASVPLASATLVLDAGEMGLAEERAGLAVLAGETLQGGTARRTGTELAEALEGLGSAFRVATGWDGTTIGFTCLAERFDEMFALLSEMVQGPSFPSDEVERVRNQRLAAIAQRRMDPGDLADDAMDRTAFDVRHPYHRPLAGTEASIGALGPEAVRAFATSRYSPAGGGLVVVGDLLPDHVTEIARRHLGEWTAPTDAGPSSPLPPGSVERRVVIVRRPGAVQSEIRIGHVGPQRGVSDEIPLRVANLVLGGAFTSRLNLSLRERHGFTYGVHSHFSFRRSGGAFTIGTAVQTEVTAPALAEAMAVVRRFADEGPTADELDRARDYLAGVFPLRMETTAQLAGRLAELVLFRLPDDYHHLFRERIRAVTLESARAAVRAHLHPERAGVVVVGDAERILPEVEALELGSVEVLDG